jgi:UPF0755 protein
MKKALRGVLIFLILVMLAGITTSLVFVFWADQAPTVAAGGEMVVFQIRRGESLGSIALRLQENRLIRSALYLKLYSRYKGTENLFKAGSFEILGGLDARGVHDVLVYGEEIHSTVVIPEGWTLTKVARYLEQKGITTADDFMTAARDPDILSEYAIPADSVEGYLFPDTYSFPLDYPAKEMVNAMVLNFFNQVESLYPEYRALAPEEFHKKLIVASIVEKEYRLEDEAPLMASVFYNRLTINIHLQSCATVIYTITEVQKRPHPDRLFNSDLVIDSRYNTYKYLGLPQGPISNPGLVSLRAAFFPADTNYYFFVLEDPEIGNHTFTTYLDEHIEAKYQNKHLYQ